MRREGNVLLCCKVMKVNFYHEINNMKHYHNPLLDEPALSKHVNHIKITFDRKLRLLGIINQQHFICTLKNR